MKIPIHEVEERFGTIDQALANIISCCGVIIDKAKLVCPSTSVNDVPGYALEFCRKTLMQAMTLVKVANEREDYNTTCSLVRMLADNVSIIRLIYAETNTEEKILRHLLYVMDGVSTRIEYLKDYPKEYDGEIPRETYEALCIQVQEAKNNALGSVDFCTNAIKARPLYSAHQLSIDELVKCRNWKYKTIDKPKKKDAYAWNEMYQLLDVKDKGYMFSYFSQYVHGLSISNIALNDKDDFEIPLAFAFSLVGWVFNFLRKEYEPYIGAYTMEDVLKIVSQRYLEELTRKK